MGVQAVCFKVKSPIDNNYLFICQSVDKDFSTQSVDLDKAIRNFIDTWPLYKRDRSEEVRVNLDFLFKHGPDRITYAHYTDVFEFVVVRA